MKRWLWVIIGLLVGSLTVNLLLGLWARGYYWELNQTRLDPVGLTMYIDGMTPPKLPGRQRVLFYGDSRAFSWPAPAGLENFEFINRGIGGQTTAQILARFDAHVTPLQPDLVILQAGINDLKTLGLFPAQRDTIIEHCKKNLAAMVQRTTEQGAKVMLTTIFPPGQPSPLRRLFWSDEIGPAVTEVNDFLATLVGEQVILFDSASLLMKPAGRMKPAGTIDPAYSHDLLHLNQAGYDVLNQALIARLQENQFKD